MKNVIKIFLKYWMYILGACLCLVGEGLCELQLPGYISDIITYGVAASDLTAVKEYGLKMILYTLGAISFAIAVGYFSTTTSVYTARDLRLELFTKTINLDTQNFNKFTTSSLITRCSNDISQIQAFTSTFLKTFMLIPIMGIGGIIKAFEYSGGIKQIQDMIVIGIFIIICVIIVAVVVVLPSVTKMQRKVDDVNRISSNQLNGKIVIRSFNKEEDEEKKFDKANVELMKSTMFVNRIMAVMIPAMTTVMYVISILILVIIKNVVDNVEQIANMLAFVQYVLHIITAFTMIAMVFILMPRSVVASKRIEEVLKIENEKTCKDKEDNIGGFAIKFDDVSYTYNDNQKAIDGISFEIKEGESVGIIGSTGSGKTTLVKLIPSLLVPQEGEIYLGETSIKDISKKTLRSKIAFVPQKSFLFSGTIKSNVTYNNKDLGDLDILDILSMVHLDDLMDEEGIDKRLSQGGSNVSGGQKQRLSIARALAKNAEIYIFDDAFSSLDYKTERLVRNSIEERLKNKTKVFVSQRVSSIKDLDKIIVLDKGKIVAVGNHKDLINTCSLYKQIAISQFAVEV